MTAREILAYAITHAPKGVKGGPYEADDEGTWGTATPSLRPGHAVRWRTRPTQERVDGVLRHVREVHPHARVIRIVRKARPSEASAMLETARRRLAAVAESMTEHAYQEMASALEVDACRAGPSGALDVEVLRELVAWSAAPALHSSDVLRIADSARRVLASAGPDPSEVVRAAMAWGLACKRYGGRPLDLEIKTLEAVDAYRKAGGK